MKAVGCGDKAGQADFLHRFYKIMDRDGDKQLDFRELLDGLAILLGGTPKQKLQLFFVMYAYHDPNMVGKHYQDDAVRAELDQGLSMFNVNRVLMAVLQYYCGVEDADGDGQADSMPDEKDDSAVPRTFEQKQADFNKFHNSLDGDGDGQVTFEELWVKFSSEKAVLSCIEGESKLVDAEPTPTPRRDLSAPKTAYKSGSSGRNFGSSGRGGGRGRSVFNGIILISYPRILICYQES